MSVQGSGVCVGNAAGTDEFGLPGDGSVVFGASLRFNRSGRILTRGDSTTCVNGNGLVAPARGAKPGSGSRPSRIRDQAPQLHLRSGGISMATVHRSVETRVARVFLSYKRNVEPDQTLAAEMVAGLERPATRSSSISG